MTRQRPNAMMNFTIPTARRTFNTAMKNAFARGLFIAKNVILEIRKPVAQAPP